MSHALTLPATPAAPRRTATPVRPSHPRVTRFMRPAGVSPRVSEIDVIREADLKPGDPTPGIVRRRAFDVGGVLVAQSRVAAGVVSGWHHHGTRTLFGYLVSGRLRFDYGPGGKDSMEVHPGEYFRISPGAIHRDVNPSPTEDLVVVNVILGDGPSLVNVAGPAGWGRRELSAVVGPSGRPSDSRARGHGRGAARGGGQTAPPPPPGTSGRARGS